MTTQRKINRGGGYCRLTSRNVYNTSNGGVVSWL